MIVLYVWLDDMPLAQVSGPVSTPSFAFVHTGQIGEPLMVTDAGQAKLWDVAVDPWGNALLLSASSIDQDLRYPGQRRQAESGLFQNWMRDYDPKLGRYIETDPIGLEGGSNPYLYVEGNPLSLIDPEGLRSVPAGQAIDVAYDWWWKRQLRPSRATPWGRAWGAGEFIGAAAAVGYFLCTQEDDDDDPCEEQRRQDELECNSWHIKGPYGGYSKKEGFAICMRTAATRFSECRARGMDPSRITTPLFLPGRPGIEEPRRSRSGRRR